MQNFYLHQFLLSVFPASILLRKKIMFIEVLTFFFLVSIQKIYIAYSR